MKRKNLLLLTPLLLTQIEPVWAMWDPGPEIDERERRLINRGVRWFGAEYHKKALDAEKKGAFGEAATHFFDLHKKAHKIRKKDKKKKELASYYHSKATSAISLAQKIQLGQPKPQASMNENARPLGIFDNFIGKEITLECSASQNPHKYLDSYDGKVRLSSQIYKGTHWTVEKNPDNSYSFKCSAPQRNENKYLDSYNGNIYLSPQTSGIYTGTHWAVEKNPDNTYSFKCLGPRGNENKYLDSYNENVHLSPQKSGIYMGTHWRVGFLGVFDNFVGREITLRCYSPQNTYKYLDAYDGKAHLSPQTSGIYTGTHWTVEKNTDNSYSFRCLGSQNDENKYLDSYAGKIHLSPSKSGIHTGTHWAVEKSSDNTYSFKCLGPREDESKYLDSYVDYGNVYLSPQSGGIYTGTYWKVGLLDLTHSEVYNAISNVYKTEIKYHTGPFQALTTDEVTQIWENSDLRHYNYQLGQFQCCSYALCLQAECAKWIYNEPQLFKKKLPAFGVISGSRTNAQGGTENHAYNFYITPYLELKLIEPQNGRETDLHEWAPYHINIMQTQ